MIKKYSFILILILIIGIGGFLRLYRIGDYMTFLGDEGRDMLVVKRMIVDHHFTLLGPITSVGLMHLGPVYYYFMAPFLWLSRLDPVGPAIMVALFSLATILLIWKLAREFFDSRVAIISSLLYAISPLVIIQSHSSWNPNILPFWSLLIIYGLLKATIKGDNRWLLIIGLSLGIVLQLHYVALVFVPIIILSLFQAPIKPPVKYWGLLVLGAIATFSPFIIFELRHKFINTITVYQFITRTGNAKSFGVMTVISTFWDLIVRLFWRLIVIKNAEISIIFLFIILGAIFYYLFTWKKKSVKRQALLLLSIWLIGGLGILSFYTGNIYDYYLTFAFPLPFLLTGVVFSSLMKKKLFRLIIIGVLIIIAIFEIEVTPILKPPNRLAAQSQEIAQFILRQSGSEKYNFALIAGKNSDHAYRYFLEIGGNTPIEIQDPNNDPTRISVMPQLFVVCEEKVCQPLGHSLWEIAGFGRAEIAGQWNVGLFKIFKLTHYKSS